VRKSLRGADSVNQDRRAAMNIQTSFNVFWAAVDQDTYDGAEDSHCPVGRGATEREAINDLVEQLIEEEASGGDKRLKDLLDDKKYLDALESLYEAGGAILIPYAGVFTILKGGRKISESSTIRGLMANWIAANRSLNATNK
jgi:hypothetical protein